MRRYGVGGHQAKVSPGRPALEGAGPVQSRRSWGLFFDEVGGAADGVTVLGFRRARHRTATDHDQPRVLVGTQRRGGGQGESGRRSGLPDPRGSAAGGAHHTCQVTAAPPIARHYRESSADRRRNAKVCRKHSCQQSPVMFR